MSRSISSTAVPPGFTSQRMLPLALLIALAFWAVSSDAQITATWTGGAGNWSPCPNQSGNALWNTCSGAHPAFPNGPMDNAIINGGPVTATGALVQNLSVGTGNSLILTPGYLEVDGTSITNNGSIQIGAGNGLQIEGTTTVTLSGSGSITMRPNAHFTGGNGSPTIIIQQPITGLGALGPGLAINNHNAISASGGELDIQPSSAGMNNSGLVEVQSGSKLVLISGPFNNTGGTIRALNGSSILLQANISGGTITTAGTGNFTLAPPGAGAGLTSLTNAGTFNVPSGANLNWQGTINNTGIFDLLGSISINGTVTLRGSGSVLMNNGQVHGFGSNPLINQQLIHGGGTFYETPLTNQATISADNTSSPVMIADATTTNKGTLQASGGGTLQLDSLVNNSGGVIQALSGSTVIISNSANGSINGGTLTTAGTGVIESQNGVLDGTVNVPTNAGKLTVHDFDLFLQGTVNNTGTITLSGNSCVIMEKPSILSGSGRLIMASTTCIFGSGLSFTNQSTIMGSGTIGDSNPMPIINDGTIIANQTSPLFIHPDASGFTNNGKVIVNPGSTLEIQGLFNGLSTSGTLSSATYSVSGTLGFPNGVVSNSANITLIGTSAAIVESGTITNALATLATNTTLGSLSFQNGQVLTTGTNFSNSGKVTIGATSGLHVGGSYTQLAGLTTVDGTLTAPHGLSLQKGSLVGKGILAAAVSSSSTLIVGDAVTKPGKLSITGSYIQNSTGVLDVAIGGATTGTQYSQLAISNGASLKGTLNIRLVNGFVPAIGETFTILTGSAVSGIFSTINGLSINSGEHFEMTPTPTAITLKVASGA